MKKEIEQKQRQKEELQHLLEEKASKEKEGKAKKELHEKVLPERAQKLYEEALEAAKLCELREFESITDILSPKLSVVNEKLVPLRMDETLQVTLSRDLYE
jgi:hypothetical protein